MESYNKTRDFNAGKYEISIYISEPFPTKNHCWKILISKVNAQTKDLDSKVKVSYIFYRVKYVFGPYFYRILIFVL
jgi:hypothetical protein